jgi:hypothetical protein
MYVINKTTSWINRVNKLNKNAATRTTNIAYFIYTYIYYKKTKWHRSKNVISSTGVFTQASHCPKMPSAVVNILQVPKPPYDHEICHMTFAILISPAGNITGWNIISDLTSCRHLACQSDPVTCYAEMARLTSLNTDSGPWCPIQLQTELGPGPGCSDHCVQYHRDRCS